MADFETRVEGLTQLTMGTDPAPSTSELTEFLKDGVLDVTNRWLAMRPQDIELFGRETTISDSQGVSVGGAKIISVIREAGADGSSDGSTAWEPCRKIPSSMQSRAVDVDSLFYASSYSPVYTINSDKAINVYPVPSSNNGFKVFYVNEEPRDISNNATLIHSHSNIKYFPYDKVYLVVIYASMRSLQAAMGATTITDLTITVVPPDTPSAPNFTAAGVTTVTARAISASAPTYDNTIASSEFGNLATLIDTDEDVELATAKLQEIQALMQNELNEFNQANIAYQQDVQEALQELQVAAGEAQKEADFTQQTQIQEYASKLQKYQNEIAAYQADVATEVQEYTQNLQADGAGYQWLQGQYAALKAEYDAAFMLAAPKQQAPQPQPIVRR